MGTNDKCLLISGPGRTVLALAECAGRRMRGLILEPLVHCTNLVASHRTITSWCHLIWRLLQSSLQAEPSPLADRMESSFASPSARPNSDSSPLLSLGDREVREPSES